jgi:Ras-related protein Rab-4A/Ras-related protein Rab-4B
VGSGERCVPLHTATDQFGLHSHATDVHFLEASSLTGENVEAPFLLAARAVLLSIESGTLDPEKPGSGVSYGDRALRRVNSSSRLSFGSLSNSRQRGNVRLKVKNWIPGTRCC